MDSVFAVRQSDSAPTCENPTVIVLSLLPASLVFDPLLELLPASPPPQAVSENAITAVNAPAKSFLKIFFFMNKPSFSLFVYLIVI